MKKSSLNHKWWKCTAWLSQSQELSVYLKNIDLKCFFKVIQQLNGRVTFFWINQIFLSQKTHQEYKYFCSLLNKLEACWTFLLETNQQVYECGNQTVISAVVIFCTCLWCFDWRVYLGPKKPFLRNHTFPYKVFSWVSIFLRKNFDQLSTRLLVECQIQLLTCPPEKICKSLLFKEQQDLKHPCNTDILLLKFGVLT